MIDFIDNNSDLDTVNFIEDAVAKKFMELWKE